MHIAARKLMGYQWKTCRVGGGVGCDADGDDSLVVLQIGDEAADGGLGGWRKSEENQKTSGGYGGSDEGLDWRSQ